MLNPGTRLGSYEILGSLGAGGMGEVYRARDTTLGREVALKILPDAFAGDADRLLRFEREARTLAALNHPHIAQVYGFEAAPTATAGAPARVLVMELVDGDDLAQRIARGAIPLDEALPIARQIADALESAHDAGVVHRDLKPANVKVRADGTVKLLDFGLAKPVEAGPASAVESPTITSPLTMRGVILGTAAYMAPEQAKGKPVDRRADIWAFGCLLYEMLTGTRAFAGADVSETLVAIFRDEPRWATLPAATPPHLRRLLRLCLQKDPRQRLPHIGIARLELEDARQQQDEAAAPATTVTPRRRALGFAAAFLIGAVTAAGVASALRPSRDPAAGTAVRFAIEPPDGGIFTGATGTPRFAISPDGQTLVFQAQSGGSTRLWQRRLDALDAQPMPDFEDDANGLNFQQPFWSPDGRWLAFFEESTGRLRKMDRGSGVIQTVATLPGTQYGGTWNDDGVILAATAATQGVLRITPSGEVTPVTTLDAARSEQSHLWPEFFPDGRRFLYLALSSDPTQSALFVGSIDGVAPVRVMASTHMARLAAPDRLLYVRDEALVSQRFDLDRLQLVGEPTLLVSNVAKTQAGRVAVSASRTGVIVYGPGGEHDERFDAVWLDRRGQPIPALFAPRRIGHAGIRLSPDKRLLAYVRHGRAGEAGELWVADVARGIETRLSGVLDDVDKLLVFSPDSSRLVFQRRGSLGSDEFFEQPLSGAAGRTIFKTEGRAAPLDWSRDGRFLLFTRAAPEPGLWMLPFAGDPRPRPYRIDLEVRDSVVSPDSQWVAYTAGPPRERQVFLQAFSDPAGDRWPVAGPASGWPRWRGDGEELYLMTQRQMQAVTIRPGTPVQIAAPVPLFSVDIPPGTLSPYDVSADGSRFIVLREASRGQPRRLVVARD